MQNSSSLKSLFNPKSIAVVGVSKDHGKLASQILFNIIEFDYKGKIYPINPKYDQLFGMQAYPSVSAIGKKVDMMVVVVPKKFVKAVVEDGAEAGVKAAIIITAGFGEIDEEGRQLQEEIATIAREAGMRIVGPNCLGVITPANKVNASFADSSPLIGNTAFFSQSGAFCTAMLDLSLEKQLGFSHFVSFGNKVDVDEVDLIEAWLEDEHVKVIGGYIEEVESGNELVKTYQNSDVKKPLILLKPGASEAAQSAISSHTGSLAGSMQTFQTAMQQSGIVQATRVNQMFNLMMAFSWAKLPKGNRVAVVTNAGGPGIIATDALVDAGLEMADISEQSKKEMEKVLPDTASLKNPVDLIGDALADRYQVPIDTLQKDENVDAILVILTPQSATQIEETAKYIASAAKLAKKPIYAVFLGGKYILSGMRRLYDGKVPAYRYIHDAVEAISAMYEYDKFVSSKDNSGSIRSRFNKEALTQMGKGSHRKKLESIHSAKKNDDPIALDEDLVTALAAEVGIALPGALLTDNIDEATKFAKQYERVVLKATTDVIAHKTDKKALYLNLSTDVQVKEAFTELQSMIEKEFGIGSAKLLLQEQVVADLEMFVGANRDGDEHAYESHSPGFGHLLAYGTGGIYTEVYKDIAYSLTPATKQQIESSLKETHVYEILAGARGKEPLAIKKVLHTIEAVQKLVILYPQISSLDINPLLVTKDRAVCVDLKVFV
jgi:acetyltransferase